MIVLFSGREGQRAPWREALEKWRDALDVPFELFDDPAAVDPARVDVLVANPYGGCLLYTSPSPRDGLLSRMPSSA